MRDVINGKAGKPAALPKVNPISIRRADYAQPLALPHLKYFWIKSLLIEIP